MTSSRRGSSPLRALLLVWCAAASSVCAPRGSASQGGPAAAVRCLQGETCGYLAPSFRSANCCGYAVGPYPDALACKGACVAHASSVGRSTSDCAVQGQRHNEAFTPPCGYTPYASCPLPPAENKLKIAIEAGERYTKH